LLPKKQGNILDESQRPKTSRQESKHAEETKTGLPHGEIRKRIRHRRERTASRHQGSAFSKVSAATEASRLLNNPCVQGLVNEHLAKNAVLAELKAQEVIDGIRRNILRCEGVGENYKPFAALKGYEMLGKHLRLFSQKLELTNRDALIARLHERRKRNAGQSDTPNDATGNS
jgi:hypothetical protein